jgi:hypothetical protein
VSRGVPYADMAPEQKAQAVRRVRRRQVRLQAAGKCIICGKPAVARSTGACEEHRVARNVHMYNYRKRRAKVDPEWVERVKARLLRAEKRRVARRRLARTLMRLSEILWGTTLDVDAEALDGVTALVRGFNAGFCSRGHPLPPGADRRRCGECRRRLRREAVARRLGA